MKKKIELVLPDYPINKGDRGLNVSRLQACFDAIYKLKGKKKLESIEPAYCGMDTYSYLLMFQTEHECRNKGTYDRLTRQKLREVLDAD